MRGVVPDIYCWHYESIFAVEPVPSLQSAAEIYREKSLGKVLVVLRLLFLEVEGHLKKEG